MAKRRTKKPTKNLTEKVKVLIKRDYAKLKFSDFEGPALAYLKQVRGGHKGRRTQAESVARFGEFKVPKDSELYQMIVRGAKIKKMSVKKFVNAYKKELIGIAEHGDFVQQRETEYLIEDVRAVKKGRKVFVNDGNGYLSRPKLKDVLNIQLFTQHVMGNTEIFLLIYRVHYKTTGDLSHFLPSAEEYEELEDADEIEAMLDGFYPEITYLKSGKGNAAAKEETVIEPDAPERKKKSSKAGANNRKKRARVSTPAKKK